MSTGRNTATGSGGQLLPIALRAMRWGGRAVVYCAGLVALWWLAIRILAIPQYLVPTPEDVFASLVRLPGYYARHFGVTFAEATLGLLWGFSTGVVLGILIRYGSWAGRLLAPIVLALQTFPMFALAPLFVTYLGHGLAPKVVICGLIVLLPAVIHTWRGLRSTPSDVALTMHVMGATRFQTFWFADRVYATPHILAAWRQGALLAVIGAVVGEFSGAAGSGLAYSIQTSLGEMSQEKVFACLVLLAVMGGIFYAMAVFTELLVHMRHGNSRAFTGRHDNEP